MDNTDYGLGAASAASDKATGMASSLPSVLQDLKGSLNQIFAKDNPLVQQRGTQLADYLSAADKARAEYLPTHSGFAFSPTELNAMVSARQASALGPLAGTNQMLVNQYGGLTDYLSTARDTFQAAVQAAQANASKLWQVYQANAQQHQQELANQLEQKKYAEGVRQFNVLHGGGTGTGTGSGLTLGTGNNTGLNLGLNTFSPQHTALANSLGYAGPFTEAGSSGNRYVIVP